MGTVPTCVCCDSVQKEGTTVQVTEEHPGDFYVSGASNAQRQGLGVDMRTKNTDAPLLEQVPCMGRGPKFEESPQSSRSKDSTKSTRASDRVSDKASDMTSDLDAHLTLTFYNPERGGMEEVTCHFRPLGINFGKKVPMTVKSLEEDSSAKEVGVQKGWQLMKLNGDDVSNQEFQDIVKLLKEATKPLRVVGSARRPASRGSSRSARS